MPSYHRLDWNGRRIDAAAHSAAAAGLLAGAEHVLAASQLEVPIDTRLLEDSGQVSLDETDLVAAVSYDTDYAVRQHEDVDLQHPVGKAKYLEDPLLAAVDDVRDIVATAIRTGLGG